KSAGRGGLRVKVSSIAAAARLVSFDRNGWSACSGMGGQIGPKRLVRFEQNGWSDSSELRTLRFDYLGAQIGYLPRSQNQVISRLLQQGAPVECHIARIDEDAPPWQAVTVKVSIQIEG